jgi:hypothetical protein
MMTDRIRGILRWVPRVLGICVALFIGLFALDSVSEGIGPFLMHLIPTFVLLAVVAIAWRREWIGGAVFTGLGLAYGVSARAHPDWVMIIAGPMVLVGALYLLSRSTRTPR